MACTASGRKTGKDKMDCSPRFAGPCCSDPPGSHPQQLLTVFRAEHSLLIDIPTGWEPRTEQQPTGLIARPASQGRAVRILPVAQKKKSPGTMCLGFSWCTSRTHIRTFLRFHSFPESDRFCTFLIIKYRQKLTQVFTSLCNRTYATFLYADSPDSLRKSPQLTIKLV